MVRFDPDLTNNQGPYWLRNVYFVYLLELRAIVKAAPAILNSKFEFGNSDEDKETLEMVKKIIEMMKSFPDQFDESGMFSGSLEQVNVSKSQQTFLTTFFSSILIKICKSF
jgi:ERO1-like protein alpha